MAHNVLFGTGSGSKVAAKQAEVIKADGQDIIELPDAAYIRDAELTRDGQDLVLEVTGHKPIVVEGYFAADPAPKLTSSEGFALTPELVQSFAKAGEPLEYAANDAASDVSPVGAVKEVTGTATVTRTDGTNETVSAGTVIYQGDIVETEGEGGAVNIMFIDESSVVVSQNARLAIDEYVFDPATQGGATNLSILRGLFVYTSGLVGREDPDDVEINTPHGSIGIRGTIIAGNVDSGQITVLEGAIVLRPLQGNEITLSERYETARFDTQSGGAVHEGTLEHNDFAERFNVIRAVSPEFFTGLGDGGAQPDGAAAPDDAGAMPEEQSPEDSAPEDLAPENVPQEGGELSVPGSETMLADGSMILGEPKTEDMMMMPPPGASMFMMYSMDIFMGGMESSFDMALSGGDGYGSFDTAVMDMMKFDPSLSGDAALAPLDPLPLPDAPLSGSYDPYFSNNYDPFFMLPPPPTVISGGSTGSGSGTTTHYVLNLMDLTNAGAGKFFIVEDSQNSQFAHSITAMGDVNSDGFDDIGFTPGLNIAVPAGASYLLAGSATQYANGTRGGYTTSQGLAFGGSTNGLEIASIGDFAGNGQDYYIVGAPNADSSNAGSGQIKIFNADTGSLISQMTNLAAGDMTGDSIAGIGDINRDGFADVIIGAPGAGGAVGASYILFGKSTPTPTYDAGAITTTQGFVLNGLAGGDEFGANVSGIGDFNNDSYDDFIVTMPGSEEAHIVFGNSALGTTVPTLHNGTSGDTLRLTNIDSSLSGNMPVTSLGDVDGDGVSDIAVAATDAGLQAMYIFYGDDSRSAGSISAPAAASLKILSDQPGRILVGGGAAGDFNSDGHNDIVAIFRDSGTGMNDIYVIYGRDTLSGTIYSSGLNDNTKAFHMTFNTSGVTPGVIKVTAAGDINGDGFEDLALGIPGLNLNANPAGDGQAIIVYGRETAGAQILNTTTATAGNQKLIGTQGADIFNDGGHNDTTMKGGSADDIFQLSNMNFNHIDGGSGWDTMRLMSGSMVDLRSFAAEDIQGIEILEMSALGGQTLLLNLENIFNLLRTSEKNKLYIDANGGAGNELHIQTGSADSLVITTEMQTILGSNPPSGPTAGPGGSNYYHFDKGGYTIAIDTQLFAGNNIETVV